MDTRESAPAVRNHRPTGDDTMQMATTLRRSTHTFLTHLFGPGLDDDRYVIERFQSKADARMRPERGIEGAAKRASSAIPPGGAMGRRRRAGARLPARSSP